MSNQTNSSTNMITTNVKTTLVGASELISMDGDVRLLFNSLRITKLHILLDEAPTLFEYILAPNSHPLIIINTPEKQDEPQIENVDIPLIVRHPRISGIEGFIKLQLRLSIEPHKGTILLNHINTVLEFLQFRQKDTHKSEMFGSIIDEYTACDLSDDTPIAKIDNPYFTPKKIHQYFTHAINVVGYEIDAQRTTCHDRNRVETHSQ